MEFEEFQESDVMFSYDHSWDQINGNHEIHGHRHGQYRKGLSLPRSDKKEKKQQQQMKKISSSPRSLPVNIQTTTGFSRYHIDMAGREPSDQSSDEDQDDYDYDADDEIMGRLPPHMIVERRVSGEIARSFSPLKGRNLYQVRNNILRMTGFLER